MAGGRGKKLFVLVLLAAVAAAVVKALRGDPAPAFSGHPSVDDGEVTSGPRGGGIYDSWASPLAEEPEPPAAGSEAAAGSQAGTRPALAVVPDPDVAAGTSDDGSVGPVDGGCPDGYPVKAKKSGVFRAPGDAGYETSKPDRCYATAAAAEAAGLRHAKR